MTVIHPRPEAWEEREQEVAGQNALWAEQERLYTALALNDDPVHEQVILGELDCTYGEVARRGWTLEWERRSYAVPEQPTATVHEIFGSAQPVPTHSLKEDHEQEQQLELSLELH